MDAWNPWHGCRRVSPGCKHCYVFRRDEEYGLNPQEIRKTKSFSLPVQKNRRGDYKLKREKEIFTCGTSDFFLEEADEWRIQAWQMIRERSDLDFLIITKRIQRFTVNLPEDWGEGYPNVHIGCTCENQNRTDYRMPVFLSLPICHRHIIHEPMLEPIEIAGYLEQGGIESVICGGESGPEGRVCDYAWIMNTMLQCVEHDVPFHFKQTGTHFKRGEKIYTIGRKDQCSQAAKAGIDYKYKS